MNKSQLLKMRKLIVMSGLIAGAPLLSGCDNKEEIKETNLSSEDKRNKCTAIVLDNDSYIIYDYESSNSFNTGWCIMTLNNKESVQVAVANIVVRFENDEYGKAHDKALEYLSVVNKDNKYPVIDYDDEIQPKYNQLVKNKQN